jgi:uncharacterized membrane protein
MSEKKRKAYYFLFKVLSILISCAFPLYAICEKFPLWKTTYGNTRSIGVGTIIAIIVLAIIFRTTVFNFIRDKLKITHAPPLVVWLILLAISYVLVFIGQFMGDVVVVLWMGLIGCSIGTVLTLIAEHKFGKKEDRNGQS